jgi:hypothetical protein
MYVTAVSGDGNLLVVARGANGTAPAPHAGGAAVTVLTDYSVNAVPTCSLVRPRLPRDACLLHVRLLSSRRSSEERLRMSGPVRLACLCA